MTWTNLTYAFGSVLTSSKMTQNQDNFTALANGDSGAPPVQNAALAGLPWQKSNIDSSAVGQNELDTTESTNSDSGSSGGETLSLVATVPGGNYGFNYRYWVNNTGSFDSWNLGSSSSSSSNKRIGVHFDAGYGGNVGSRTLSIRAVSVTASPPYDLGDGVVAGFLYVRLSAEGEIQGVSASILPPWYGVGKDSPIRQRRDAQGKAFGTFLRPKATLKEIQEGRASLRELLQDGSLVEEVEEELTMATKLRGMEQFPHPFARREEGDQIILVDPLSREVENLIQLMHAGEELSELFEGGYLALDNTALDKRAAPPGVAVHALKWS